ncbi:hypothetical protein L6255_01645 [Candidatus Parcubacteria bacterium]|nr:hypothetical protein [Patescibacteria group bacterium]MCG2689120.1 hypothetical protein [Candidatus Parcubacteria bacterium]
MKMKRFLKTVAPLASLLLLAGCTGGEGDGVGKMVAGVIGELKGISDLIKFGIIGPRVELPLSVWAGIGGLASLLILIGFIFTAWMSARAYARRQPVEDWGIGWFLLLMMTGIWIFLSGYLLSGAYLEFPDLGLADFVVRGMGLMDLAGGVLLLMAGLVLFSLRMIMWSMLLVAALFVPIIAVIAQWTNRRGLIAYASVLFSYIVYAMYPFILAFVLNTDLGLPTIPLLGGGGLIKAAVLVITAGALLFFFLFGPLLLRKVFTAIAPKETVLQREPNRLEPEEIVALVMSALALLTGGGLEAALAHIFGPLSKRLGVDVGGVVDGVKNATRSGNTAAANPEPPA